MSKQMFHLRVDDLVEIHELLDSWTPERLREVLERADFGDVVTDEEAMDMATMALQDLDQREASELVLAAVFGDSLSSGIRQNLVGDLDDDRPWEQFASVDKQAGIFDSVVLLQRAFPARFGVPDAVRLQLSVTASDGETREWLREGPTPALIVRMLASGMDGKAVLNRLYAAELQSDSFADAGAILWRCSVLSRDEDATRGSCVLEIYSSSQWLGPLEDRGAWEGEAWPDLASAG